MGGIAFSLSPRDFTARRGGASLGNGAIVYIAKMAFYKELRLWGFATALVLLSILVSCCVYFKSGTTAIGDFVSPDGKWDALLMVRNGGAMTSYSTAISMVRANHSLSRQVALFRSGNLFVIDDNDGAVRVGDLGQIDVNVNWVSSTHLVITYPQKVHINKQESSFRSVTVKYVPVT
jgi:hypothetical protein